MRQKLLAASYGENTNGKRPPGRPRSEKARQAILRSTLKVLGKNGFADHTIEEVADRAAVGKATVYRWWPNKAALIADAFAISTTRHLHFPDTGSVYTDMSRQMRQLAGKNCFRHPGGGTKRPRSDRRVSRAFPVAASSRSLRDSRARDSPRRTPQKHRPRSSPRLPLRPDLHALPHPTRPPNAKLRRSSLRTRPERRPATKEIIHQPPRGGLRRNP